MLSVVSPTSALDRPLASGRTTIAECAQLPGFTLLGGDEIESPWRMLLWTAFCLNGSAAAALMRHPWYAIALLAGAAGAAFWWYVLDTPAEREGSRALPAPAVVVLIALGLVPPLLILRLARVSHARGAASAPTRHHAASGHNPDSDAFQSVILWPEPPRRAAVRPPKPEVPADFMSHIARPLVIPFTGAYWYYRDGAGTVGTHPHVARGTPASINFHSTDFHRLVMEAHQDLATGVDPRCCREIDVSILNADTNPGGIRIGLVLMNYASHSSQSLGVRRVQSSEPPLFTMDRSPVAETLRFAVPSSLTLRSFDRLKVLLLPSAERSLGGVKITIREFRLIPPE